MTRIVGVVSGGFDPLHAGHARMLLRAEEMCDHLVVLVNTEDWLFRKKGYAAVPLDQRMEVVQAIVRGADVRPAQDDDDTVVESLKQLRGEYPRKTFIHFYNGGDRGPGNVPEASVEGIQLVYGVGGDTKTNSSSLINRVNRLWGYYVDHYRTQNTVFKTIHLNAQEATSRQRHFHRGEFWYVQSGNVLVSVDTLRVVLEAGETIHVPQGAWHQMRAVNGPAVVMEMQYGEKCAEDDIERSYQ